MRSETTEAMVTIQQEVEQFIRDNFFYEGAPLSADTSFIETGVIDSTGVLELVAFIEDKYAIKVGNDEITLENLGSLGRIEAFVARKRAHAKV